MTCKDINYSNYSLQISVSFTFREESLFPLSERKVYTGTTTISKIIHGSRGWGETEGGNTGIPPHGLFQNAKFTKIKKSPENNTAAKLNLNYPILNANCLITSIWLNTHNILILQLQVASIKKSFVTFELLKCTKGIFCN